MDVEAFETTYKGILELNEEDGPHHNVLEPKFQARDQAVALEVTLKNCLKDDAKCFRAIDQLSRVYMFIGNNMAETDEEKEALEKLLRSYNCIKACIDGTMYNVIEEPKGDLIPILKQTTSLVGPHNNWQYVGTYCEVLNSLGVYLSNRDGVKQRVGDALHVLHIVED